MSLSYDAAFHPDLSVLFLLDLQNLLTDLQMISSYTCPRTLDQNNLASLGLASSEFVLQKRFYPFQIKFGHCCYLSFFPYLVTKTKMTDFVCRTLKIHLTLHLLYQLLILACSRVRNLTCPFSQHSEHSFTLDSFTHSLFPFIEIFAISLYFNPFFHIWNCWCEAVVG